MQLMLKLCWKQPMLMGFMTMIQSIIRMPVFLILSHTRRWLQRILGWWIWLQLLCARRIIFQVSFLLSYTNLDGYVCFKFGTFSQSKNYKTKSLTLKRSFLSRTVVVFNLNKPGNISRAITGKRVGTLIGGSSKSTVARTW